MRTFLILLFTLMAVTATMAVVCEPNICSRVRCAQMKAEDCAAKGTGYQLVEHAGFCGCCSMCVKLAKEGEHCQHLLGVPHHTLCVEGLHCDAAKHVCTKNQ